jgi:signal transduction histidine kinase/DNA-binding response OmpR family regulator
MIYAFILLLLVRWYRGYLIKREKINADLKIREAEVSKMQELDHMKSRFFANISHEFRTPLTLILGPIEELRKQLQGNPEGSLPLFQTVKRNTQRLQDLINQLLDISKLKTGNVNLQVSLGNLVEFVKAIVLSFLSLAEYKKIKYEYGLPEEGSMVHFDPDKIEKILTNLISNAFKFTNEGGNIRVGIRFPEASPANTPDSFEIKVSDTGKGIPEEMLNKIFDRFYQVRDSDSREVEGTGLGLALTKELVDLYRGNIIVESEVGKGSTFTVNLPVSEEQFREEEIVSLPSDEDIRTDPVTPVHEHDDYEDTEIMEGQNSDVSKDKPVILIVEDNADLRKYISRNLNSSYSILFAENGKIGLDKAHENIPDLVISDVMMPEMDGMEMCKHLKTDERTDHIPVIMLTARADIDSKLEGLETGADDYLVKPFNPEELKVRVKNLLEQRRKLSEKFRLEFLSNTTDIKLSPKDQFLNRLLDIFDQHISDSEFKINQLSGELNLSQSQVRRKVMAISGYAPNELFRNHRLKKAAVLFRSGHMHVAQVMNLVGFNNQSYFAKCFGELFEMTPSQFIAAVPEK